MVANGAWTMPSHGSLFTGLYPSQHGLHWQFSGRLNASVTLARWLRERNYVTVCATSNGLISYETGLAEGFDHYLARARSRQPSRARRTRNILLGPQAPGKALNEAIRAQLMTATDRPLFLFVNYLHCHWPYISSRQLERSSGSGVGLTAGVRYRATVARTQGPWEAIARADAQTLATYSDLYDAALAGADERLAELLDILAANHRLRSGESLLIVTSDHGEHLGEHGLADHQASLDPHLTRIPFVAYAPARIQPGRVRSFHELVDVFPSIARFLGEDAPAPELAGRRSGMFMEDAEAEPSDGYAFTEWRGWSSSDLEQVQRKNPSFDFAALPKALVSVRDPHYQLVRDDRGDEVLYDLQGAADLTDVHAEHPRVVDRLQGRLDAAIAEWSAWDRTAASLTDGERSEIERRLEDLGYI